MKHLTIYDYDEIKEYLDMADYEGYNSNFVTMMMWNHEYHIEYEIHDNFLITLHRYKNEHFWSMPFTTKKHYKEAIDYMIKYSHEHDFPFKIDCAIKDFVDCIKEEFQDQLLYKRTRYNDDYIYDKNMHLTLSGKKMQKRRNHYNSFIKEYPNYEYREMHQIKDFNDVLRCLSKWGNDKEELSESIISEVYGIMYLFSCRDLLNIKAGGIYIDNQLEAFIIASPLNHKTIQIIAEKANKNIRGLYPAILKEFLEHNFSEYMYINREEDMGLENLMKSKKSLHPIKMIEKYQITLNDTKIVKATNNDEQTIKDIWETTFHDETEKSTKFYFEKCYKEENTYLTKIGNEIISGMQIVPFNLCIDNKIEEVYFVLGVFTKEEYKGQGLMKRMFKYVLNLDRYKNKRIYLQAYNPEIYKSLGFKPSHYHYIYDIDSNLYHTNNVCKIVEDVNLDILVKLYNEYVSNYNEYRIRDINYYKWLLKRTLAFDQKLIAFDYNNEIEGYVIYSEESDHIYISEIIYKNNESLERILSTMILINKDIIIETDLNTNIFGNKKEVISMLSNKSNIDFKSKYINEVY